MVIPDKILLLLLSKNQKLIDTGLSNFKKLIDQIDIMEYRFSLTDQDIGASIIKVFEYLSERSGIESIYLDNTTLREYGVEACMYLSCMCELTTLSLSNCDLNEHAAEACWHLSNMPQNDPSISIVDNSNLVSSPIVQPYLTALNLSDNNLAATAVQACSHLKTLPNLSILILRANHLNRHAVTACMHLSEAPSLTTLNLSNNELGEYAVGACMYLSEAHHLTDLDLSANDLEQHAIAACELLKNLSSRASFILHLQHNALKNNAVTACMHLNEMFTCLTLNLKFNNLKTHANLVCEVFRRPTINRTLFLGRLPEQTKQQCQEIALDTNDLYVEESFEKKIGSLWLHRLFCKKSNKSTRLFPDDSYQHIGMEPRLGQENKEEYSWGAESESKAPREKQIKTKYSDYKSRCIDPEDTVDMGGCSIPGPVIEKIFNFSRPVAKLKIECN